MEWVGVTNRERNFDDGAGPQSPNGDEEVEGWWCPDRYLCIIIYLGLYIIFM